MTNLIAYDYLRMVMKEEFLEAYLHFVRLGILHYELTSIQEICAPLLTGLNGDDRFLRYEVIGTITDYLQEEQNR